MCRAVLCPSGSRGTGGLGGSPGTPRCSEPTGASPLGYLLRAVLWGVTSCPPWPGSGVIGGEKKPLMKGDRAYPNY